VDRPSVRRQAQPDDSVVHSTSFAPGAGCRPTLGRRPDALAKRLVTLEEHHSNNVAALPARSVEQRRLAVLVLRLLTDADAVTISGSRLPSHLPLSKRTNVQSNQTKVQRNTETRSCLDSVLRDGAADNHLEEGCVGLGRTSWRDLRSELHGSWRRGERSERELPHFREGR
jgi:hypothetical protein